MRDDIYESIKNNEKKLKYLNLKLNLIQIL